MSNASGVKDGLNNAVNEYLKLAFSDESQWSGKREWSRKVKIIILVTILNQCFNDGQS